MVEIEWTAPAFAQLESLSQALAFEVVRRAEVLCAFPEVGVKIESADPDKQYVDLKAGRQHFFARGGPICNTMVKIRLE